METTTASTEAPGDTLPSAAPCGRRIILSSRSVMIVAGDTHTAAKARLDEAVAALRLLELDSQRLVRVTVDVLDRVRPFGVEPADPWLLGGGCWLFG